MSRLLHHERCPNCGSTDNVGVYDDGHKWCFTPCGYYVPPDGIGIKEAYERVSRRREKEYGHSISLPDDFQHSIPQEPKDWLKSYEITDKEIVEHRIGWSSQYRGLIFPAFDLYGNLLLYQRRRWPEKDFHTEGRPELVDFILGDKQESSGIESGRTLCAVEDFVSTIKVARYTPTLCLWGSTLSASRIRRLSRRYENLILWLDRDKLSYVIKRKEYASSFFDRVVAVSTVRDPKACSNREIQNNVTLCAESI
jgi:hypothetical protein